MHICICRGITENAVEKFLGENPHMLGKTWAIVSAQISGEAPVCNDGQGVCTEYATCFMDLHNDRCPE